MVFQFCSGKCEPIKPGKWMPMETKPQDPMNASAASGDFLAKLRHDLRTPLNQIVGYSDMLIEEAEGQEWTDSLADLKKIHAAGRKLLDLMSKMMLGEDMNLDVMRHELYTPLNHIIGYCEILMEEVDRSGREQFFKDVQKIHSAARRLVVLLKESKTIASGTQTFRTKETDGDGVPLGEKRDVAAPAPPPETLPPSRANKGRILVVDDSELNRDLLHRRLERQGHLVSTAENGDQALEMVRTSHFDLVLLDIIMPQKNGYEVLNQLKTDPLLRHIPVIMLSALDEIDSVVRCVEMGAEDYLHKPFNPILLKARISACLEKKWLRDQEQDALRRLKAEQEKSEQLLLNILPKPIADRLKEGQTTIADHFREVTVLFADIVGFTSFSDQLSPVKVVRLLNKIFSLFDRITEKHGLEKIKTVGDTYMVVGGLPTPRPDHAEAMADLALDMQKKIKQFNARKGEPFKIRIGMNTGPVVAGVIGTKKFSYDLWGDTVNTASRMESHALAGLIQVTAATYGRLKQKYIFKKRGVISVKGKGEMTTYLLKGKKKTAS